MMFLCVVGCVPVGQAALTLPVMLGNGMALWMTEGTDSDRKRGSGCIPHVLADSLDIAFSLKDF